MFMLTEDNKKYYNSLTKKEQTKLYKEAFRRAKNEQKQYITIIDVYRYLNCMIDTYK